MSTDATAPPGIPVPCHESSPSYPAGACNLPAGHTGDHYAVLPAVEGWVRWPHDWHNQHGPGKYGGTLSPSEGGQ